MEQRVNIQYSIDIEELPSEVARMFKRAAKLIESLGTDSMKSLTGLSEDNALTLDTLDKIDNVRKHLAAIDYCMHDATNIINGYINLKMPQQGAEQQPQMPQPGPQMPDAHGMMPPNFDELSQKLQQFKNREAPE